MHLAKGGKERSEQIGSQKAVSLNAYIQDKLSQELLDKLCSGISGFLSSNYVSISCISFSARKHKAPQIAKSFIDCSVL